MQKTNMEKRANGRNRVQTVSATQEWRSRMLAAKGSLPPKTGMKTVLIEVVKLIPTEVNTLLSITRWQNAWKGRVADPEFTQAVENAAAIIADRARQDKKDTTNALSRQRLRPPRQE